MSIDAEVGRLVRSRMFQVKAQAEAAIRVRATAQLLKDRGYTVRDSGRMMGVSPQRVSQLLAP